VKESSRYPDAQSSGQPHEQKRTVAREISQIEPGRRHVAHVDEMEMKMKKKGERPDP